MSEDGIAAGVVKLRRHLQRTIATLFGPLVGWLAGRGVVPDHVTWAGFGLATAAAAFAGLRIFMIAGILFLLSGLADVIDGALARRADAGTDGGAFLDSLLDRAGEGLLHAGAAVAFALWGNWLGVLGVVLSLTGSYLTSYARARGEGLGIALEEAWASRGERVVIIGFGLILHFAVLAFWIVAAVSWATAVQRGIVARRRLSRSGGSRDANRRDGDAGADRTPPEDG